MREDFGSSEPEGEIISAPGFEAGGGEDHLVAARAYLAWEAGSTAEEPWTPRRWPLIRDQQVEWLREWSRQRGAWIDAESLGISEPGRMEHDLFPAIGSGHRVWKVTKGAGFGRQPFFEENVVSAIVDDSLSARPGTPLQYLERLCLVNEHLFPTMNRLEGFTEWKGKFAILTSQPFFVGRNATAAEIAASFQAAGFRIICNGTWFRNDPPLAIFDTGESNLIFSNGVPVPIDVIPFIPKGPFLDFLCDEAKPLNTHPLKSNAGSC